MESVTVFAPATVANVGPGYDLLGVAVDGMGDWVTATWRETAGVSIEAIEGDGGRLPREADANTAGIAAAEALKIIGATGGVSLHIRKGLPLGSGLGSSAASAVAAAWAVNALHGLPTGKRRLLQATLVAESRVSGWHADNVAPALFGGFVLIRAYDPIELVELPAPPDLCFALVTADYEIPTQEARAIVPEQITMQQHVANSGNLAALVAALLGGSFELLGRAIQDHIVEPARAPLIPAFAEVKAAALEAGALACSISGAGPTLFAICDDFTQAPVVAGAMQEAFESHAGLDSHAHVARVDTKGARVVT